MGKLERREGTGRAQAQLWPKPTASRSSLNGSPALQRRCWDVGWPWALGLSAQGRGCDLRRSQRCSDKQWDGSLY